jgi:hypothetical protein
MGDSGQQAKSILIIRECTNVSCQSSVLKGVFMTNKTLFWSFYVNFCTFCASLRLIRTVFTRPKTCLPREIVKRLPREIAKRYLTGVISLGCNPWLKSRKVKLNVNRVLTRVYDKMDTWSIRKNEPKTNPNEPKVKIGKINITIYITKGYDKTGNSAPNKTNPKQTQPVVSLSNLFQTVHLLIDGMKHNYLPVALFPLTSPAARYYNGIFSQLSCFRRQMKGFGNE